MNYYSAGFVMFDLFLILCAICLFECVTMLSYLS